MKTKPAILIILAVMLTVSYTRAQEIGLQLLSLRDITKDQGIAATLAQAKELGITELEGGARESDRKELKKLLEEYGMQLIATGAPFQRLTHPDSIRMITTAAKELGARYVVCYWIPHDDDAFTLTDMQKAVDVFNTAGKQLKEEGLELCYHPHGYEFRTYEGKGTLFDYMMEHTDPNYVNFQMDVFWIKNPGQDPVALLKKYPTRWKMLHLKDRKHGTPNNPNGRQDHETNVVLGTGDVGIAEVMKTAKKLGIKHYFIEDESSRALEQVPKSIAYLRSLK